MCYQFKMQTNFDNYEGLTELSIPLITHLIISWSPCACSMFFVLLHTKSLPLNVEMKMLFHKCRNSIWCQPTCQQARHISQSDRWLRQASIIDGWSITTIDTAIQFRKISKGKIFLDFKHWKEFLLELSATKKLELTYLISKLEMCGKPAINLTQRK